MGLLDRITDLFGTPTAEPQAEYVCIKCGATFEREERECSVCGAPHVVRQTEE
jgi:rRNA maturation endonuclease Nob1